MQRSRRDGGFHINFRGRSGAEQGLQVYLAQRGRGTRLNPQRNQRIKETNSTAPPIPPAAVPGESDRLAFPV